jgi:Ca-activated chloride channel homolog
MQRTSIRALIGTGLATMLLVAACGGGGAATPTPAAPTEGTATILPTTGSTTGPTSAAATTGPTSAAATTGAATTGPTQGPVVTAAPAATQVATGPANLNAAQEVQAGKQFDVTWTGPNAQGDYITIVLASAAKWTNESYFDTLNATSPRQLTAPSVDGAYALWYVSGADDSILARRAIRVTPFQGDLSAPASVMAGSKFKVTWHGPNGPRDYVTIVKSGATKWTDESYFYTTVGSPGTLIADIKPGSYELWYVIGSDSAVKARRSITVTPYVVTLKAPATVSKGAHFNVKWTGPNGPQDYITIVPAGSAPGSYGSYAYTQNGSPVSLTAPTTAGNYEIWYASDRVKDLVFKKITIKVK